MGNHSIAPQTTGRVGEMFAQNNQEDLVRASQRANAVMGQWDELLSLRIALQKPLDTANKLPAMNLKDIMKGMDEDDSEEVKGCHSAILKTLEGATMSLLEALKPEGEPVKRKPVSDAEVLWSEISAVQDSLQKNWEATMDKWSARLHYGSEKARAQLKVFNQSAWGQIEGALSEERRVMEKSRMPADETERLGAQPEVEVVRKLLREGDAGEDDDFVDEELDEVHGLIEGMYVHPKGLGDDDSKRAKKRKVYDAEVYDDRQLYSLLLKTFISSHNGSASAGGMRADDMAALRAYKRKKTNVDRKASKGRKIRYTVHAKLQNFMFPVPTISEMQIDRDRLFASLFQ